jgi:hypothetical protein
MASIPATAMASMPAYKAANPEHSDLYQKAQSNLDELE